MSFNKTLIGLVSLMLTAVAAQLPAAAETPSAEDLRLTAEGRQLQAADFDSLDTNSSVEVAQNRRRGASTESGRAPDFIGLGANVGFVNDVSGVVISKFSFTDKWAVRPSVSVGDDVAVLVPFTYQFNSLDTNVGGSRVSPYAGLGGSWANENNNDGRGEVSDLHLLVSAGVDVPLSRRFTLNAQANLGLFNDTEFGGTVGVGYNIGNLFQSR